MLYLILEAHQTIGREGTDSHEEKAKETRWLMSWGSFQNCDYTGALI
jgi:hypothetical protein